MLLRGFGAGVGVALVTMLVAGLSYYSSTPEGRDGIRGVYTHGLLAVRSHRESCHGWGLTAPLLGPCTK